MSPRVYLDNAATSWPKPEPVIAAVEHYLRHNGAPAGRGAYDEAVEVDRGVAAARRGVANLIGAGTASQVIFTAGCTDSLNLAIHGLLRAGDHVLTTVIEHNSVLRPLRSLEDVGVIEVTRVACDPHGLIAPENVRRGLRPNTRLAVVSHASNVTGALQPIDAIAEIVRAHGARLLVDAAQTLGHVPLDVTRTPVDLLACSGHKGLLGPLGIGILYVRAGMEQELMPTRQGGTGSQSDSDRQPDRMPDRYESGSLNVPGILGLGAAVAYLAQRGVAAIQSHQTELTQRLLSGLQAITGLVLYGPPTAHLRVGVVSINLRDYDPRELAAVLGAHYRIQVRAGLHCAPGMHESLGTLVRGGALRFSPGPFTTADEIDRAIAAIGEVASTSLA